LKKNYSEVVQKLDVIVKESDSSVKNVALNVSESEFVELKI